MFWLNSTEKIYGELPAVPCIQITGEYLIVLF